MARGTNIIRWSRAVVCVLTFIFTLVVYSAGGPWYGIAGLAVLSLGFGYVAVFADDGLLHRIDGWVATVLHWSP